MKSSIATHDKNHVGTEISYKRMCSVKNKKCTMATCLISTEMEKNKY